MKNRDKANMSLEIAQRDCRNHSMGIASFVAARALKPLLPARVPLSDVGFFMNIFLFLRYPAGIVSFIVAVVLSPVGMSLLLKFPLTSLTALEAVVLLIVSLTAAAFGAVCFWRRWDIVENILLLLVTACCLAGVDYWLAQRPEYGSDPLFQTEQGGKHFVCFPYMEGTRLPQRIRDPHTGKDWLCGVEDPAARRSGYYPERPEQVLLVGDSFTYGRGVAESETLAAFLGEAFPQFNFMNYGQPGADVRSIRQIFEQTLAEHPEVHNVVYFYNINDVILAGTVAKRQEAIRDLERLRLQKADRFATPVGRWLSHSALFRMINRVLIMRAETVLAVRNYLDSYDPQQNAEALARTVKELDLMQQFARRKGVQFTVVVYPLLYKDWQGKYTFGKIHNYLELVCTKYGIRFVDGYRAFANEPSWRQFRVHPLVDYDPNGEANRRMVDLLYKMDKVNPLFRSGYRH